MPTLEALEERVEKGTLDALPRVVAEEIARRR
jgi:hypothetical protein